MYCFGTVSWNGYLERYIDMFATNFIRLYRKLISLGVNYTDIADPKICYINDEPGPKTEIVAKKIETITGKKLQLIHDKRKYVTEKVMYMTRNRLRAEFKKSYPTDKKVFFYFPIDDNIRPETSIELLKLHRAKTPMACMFKFLVEEPRNRYTAATKPITSYKDISSSSWGRILRL